MKHLRYIISNQIPRNKQKHFFQNLPKCLLADKYSMNAGYVPEDGQFDHLWLVPDASQLWIRLQSCSHVNISLAIKPYETHNAPYFINIANNVSQIMRLVQIYTYFKYNSLCSSYTCILATSVQWSVSLVF